VPVQGDRPVVIDQDRPPPPGEGIGRVQGLGVDPRQGPPGWPTRPPGRPSEDPRAAARDESDDPGDTAER
jgi:hypothetical protein